MGNPDGWTIWEDGRVLPIVTPAEMRAVDAAAPEPVEVLVDRAGSAVARAALDLLGGAYGRTAVVIAGPGNNGADGRVAAERLRRRGVRARVVDVGDVPAVLPDSDLVIDAAYGTGFRGEWSAPGVGDAPVLAVDVPSGLDATTGAAGPGVLRADRTVTFQALKPGLVFGDGPALAGEVLVADIGLDLATPVPPSRGLVTAADVAAWWPRRPADAHKWRMAVKVIAGSTAMPGAAVLASAAALRAGAGIVVLVSPADDTAVPIGARPEVMARRVAAVDLADEALSDLSRFGAMVVGPGLGRQDDVLLGARRAIAEASVPVVVDGDGIFACAWSADGPTPMLRERTLPTVLTPHDGEFRTLTGAPPGADRIESVRRAAAELGVVLLLKGPTTVVAGPPTAEDPEQTAYVIDHGDERLATPGSGDVLSGMIGAALAGGAEPVRATAAAAWLHADAARRGPAAGLVAGDLVESLPATLGTLRDPTRPSGVEPPNPGGRG